MSDWQRCPVCSGNGIRPQGFHAYPVGQPFTAALTATETCKRCNGTGTVGDAEQEIRDDQTQRIVAHVMTWSRVIAQDVAREFGVSGGTR